MKIAILNGSPRKENTYAMCEAFAEGAKEAGHEVEILNVGKMKIAGCLGCEYCHTKGEGACIQKDDMEQVIEAYKTADMVVFASSIYYFSMTAQLSAAIQRMYCIGKPAATKAALLLSSASPNVYDGPIGTYKGITAFTGIQDMGIITACGEENKSEAKLAEVKALAASL
ncbi:MAG: flavodoxin family protein [Clostridia bacterium]|nr:flavodoxin family protein [Oscillospiraceae bacterium]MBQ4459879.1 flavodoxin family protein [Clostridia bacterium]